MNVLKVAERGAEKNAVLVSKLFHRNLHGNRDPVVGNRHRKLRAFIGGKRLYSQNDQENIVHSPLGDVKIPNLLFHEFVFENWSLWERKIAVECVKTGKKYTYQNVMRYSKALAAAFQNKLNISKGDVIALILPNCPEYPVAILGASLNGVIPTTVNPAYTIDEIHRHLKDSKAKLLITDSKAYDKCFSALQLMKAFLPVLVVKHTPDDEIPQGAIDLFELFDHSISGSLKPVDMKMEDTLVLPYSSGTTGGPKGVILSHRNIVSNLAQLNHPDTNVMNPTTRFHQERNFAVLPMFHIFGMVACAFFSLREGCRVLMLPSFEPRSFVSNLYQKKVNNVYVVPPILRVLANKDVKSLYLKRLRFVVNGASALPIHDAHALLEKAQHVKVVQGYGLTETSPVLTHTSSTRLQHLTSIGIPVASTKLKVVHPETGEALPKGEQGELCAWGPQVMKGYLNHPEETKNAFDKDGWFRTGDIAYYDENQDFYIVQRTKDLIKVKGFQVAPAEVEEVLMRHPKILEAVVVGTPDPEYGEVPRAFIIVQPNAQLTEEEVKDFVKTKLVHYKQLRGGVQFVDDFPRNKIGKVLRMELKKMS